MTNADKIRQMNDEELAKLLHDFVWAFPRSETGWLNWLREEAKSD